MKIFKLIGALILSFVLLGGGTDWVSAQENDLVREDDVYDSSFSGPLMYCTRSDTATAKSADGQTMPVLCDDSGKIRVTTAGGGGGGGTEYTEGDTDATITGTAFMWEDAADTLEPVSAASPLPVDLGANNDVTVTSGAITATLSAVDNAVLDAIDAVLDTIKLDTADIKTAVEGTLAVDGSGVTQPVSAASLPLPTGAATSAKQLADGHGVASTLVAGLLNANSPVTLIDTFSLFDGSGETQIATTNLGASKAYSVPGTGRLVQICVIVSLGTPFAENMSIIFFDADPSVTIGDAALTLAASQNITNIISLRGSDFRDNFATTKTNCQTIDEQYVAITHVVFASEGLTTYDDEDVEIRVLYRRQS